MGYLETRENILIQEVMIMDYQAIVITGTRGCKKTTIAQKICENPSFTFIKAVTTRNVVEEDDEGQHVHLSRDEFEKTKMDKLLIKIDFEPMRHGRKQPKSAKLPY
jgi:guanylate kinase